MASGSTALLNEASNENCVNGPVNISGSSGQKNNDLHVAEKGFAADENSYDSSWVNIEYLEPHLQKYYNDESFKITSLDVKPASGKGDGYGGIMLRATVTYDTADAQGLECSYIVKTIVWDEVTKTQKVYKIVEKEIVMYEHVLPLIKRLLKSIGETGDIFPDSIHTDMEREVMIMEDLKLKNYIMKDRLKGLDRKHLFLFLKRLAQIHAASAVVYEQNNEIYKQFSFGMFSRTMTAYHSFFYGAWDAISEEIGRWFGYSYYARKIKALREEFLETVARVYDNDEGDFCVLIHGDMWINNVMFNYNENNTPKDCVVYDYQYAYYGTPFLDFILFIYSSTDDETRIDHNEHLQHYYNHLKSTLIRLNYKAKIPTLFEFRQQYMKKSFLKLTALFIMYPIMTNEVGDLADIEAVLMDNERARTFKRLIVQRPEFQETIKRLLPILDREGLLDPMH